MSNLEAELDSLVTVYVRSVREALRDYLIGLDPFGSWRASSAAPQMRGNPADLAAPPSPRGSTAPSNGFNGRKGARAGSPSKEKPKRRGPSASGPGARIQSTLDRIVAHLGDVGADALSSDIRKSLSLTRADLQAATKWGVSRGTLVKHGDRATTSYSLPRG